MKRIVLFLLTISSYSNILAVVASSSASSKEQFSVIHKDVSSSTSSSSSSYASRSQRNINQYYMNKVLNKNRGGSVQVKKASSSSVSSKASASSSFINNTSINLTASIQEWWRGATTTKFLLAGANAGIVSRTVVSPLEVVATAQMVRGSTNNVRGGLVAELRSLFQAEGIKGFFKGNGANCLKVAPTRGVQFFAFERFKAMLVDLKRKNAGGDDVEGEIALSPVERLIAGGFAGMVASSMVYPIEVVKTMLTMYPGKYPGIRAAFQGVITEVGPKGLYAGLGPTLIAMFPYVGMEFMIYETAKIGVEKILNKKSDDGATVAIPIMVSLGLGALAGALAQTSAHPLDVIRKRLQVQGVNGNPVLYKNTLDCFSSVANKEGVGALYKGLGPACVATIPGTGIAYITYEFMKKFLDLSSV